MHVRLAFGHAYACRSVASRRSQPRSKGARELLFLACSQSCLLACPTHQADVIYTNQSPERASEQLLAAVEICQPGAVQRTSEDVQNCGLLCSIKHTILMVALEKVTLGVF